MEVVERTGEIAGLEVHWREAPPGGTNPILYLHGVPTASWLWQPFLERTGGVAPDLPGFGSSAKPADFDYSLAGYDRFLEAFADSVGLERFSLVVHDWGGVGLALAQRLPERVERVLVFNCVPLLPDYRWHRVARMWRRPLLGEMFMGFTFKFTARRLLRGSNRSGIPDEFVDAVWADFDHGTQRAILKLYRSAPERALARAGERLGQVKCPALVLWATGDPYIPARFGEDYTNALGGDTELEVVEDAGHWPWLDQPDLIERAARFLSGVD